MKKIFTKKGFTIVELIVVMGIMSIILVVLTDIFISALEIKNETEAYSNVEQDSRFIFSRLMYDINQAQQITDPNVIGETKNTLGLIIDNQPISYQLTNNNLELSNNLGVNQINSYETTIENISFQRIGNLGGKNTLVINITLSSKTIKKSGREINSFQTVIGIR